MFITKIKIKNFKAFNDEVCLDLKPNANGIKTDLNLGRIRKIDNKYFLPIVSIGGTNATGKTSILKAIYVFSEMIGKNNLDLRADFLARTINNKFPEILKFLMWFQQNLKDVKLNLSNSIASFINNGSLMNTASKFLTAHPVLKEKLSTKQIIDYIAEISKEWDKFKLITWLSNKHNPDKETCISITFYDQKYGEFNIEITDKTAFLSSDKKIENEAEVNIVYSQKDDKNLLETPASVNIIYEQQNGEQLLLDKNFVNDFFNYLKNVYMMVVENPDFVHVKQYIEMINKLSLKKFIKFLNIADPNIANLVLIQDAQKNILNISEIVNKDGTKTSINNLSRGTKLFLRMLYAFVILSNKNNSGLILFGEIETFLHYRLIDFFKKYINLDENKQWQFIYTSHNPIVLTSLLSNKQIFFIDYDKKHKRIIRKVSTLIKNSNSTLKSFIERKIGSAPDEALMNDVLYNDLI